MDTLDLGVAAARHVLRVLSPEDEIQVADALLESGVYTPAAGELEYLKLDPHPGFQDTGRLFRAMFRELGISLPSHDEAVWVLARHYISDVATGAVGPIEGLRSLNDEVYMAGDVYRQNKEYVGDSHGLQHLLGMYYSYGDLADIPCPEYKGLHDKAAIRRALDADVVEMAREWLVAHGLTSAST